MQTDSIINLLPDYLANQVAAGEVIQRPASVVKELLENAIDADAKKVQVIIKDAGKTLIQIVDNGKGMSETDARLCFERHATSKLKSTEDLFNILTKGFRGEALASIAAVASVELKTCLRGKESGTLIINEGCEVKLQEPSATAEGTSISVKNLFYNIPARRNFLKSNHVEFNHIIEEFTRVAMAHPEVAFTLHHNGIESYHLLNGNLRQRIVSLFGNNYNERLVPISTETSIVTIEGFIGKPEYSKKTRGEQYFFVNNRFIKSAYLNHAITRAYQELISSDSYPSYFIFLFINPSKIDVNIHPTKTEVKFEDEKSIYNILHSASRMSLGQYNVSPSLDFEQEPSLNFLLHPERQTVNSPNININPSYNPFTNAAGNKGGSMYKGNTLNRQNSVDQWESIYEIAKGVQPSETQSTIEHALEEEDIKGKIFQFKNKYIVASLLNDVVIIDQHLAHERVLFERFSFQNATQPIAAQTLLFPIQLKVSEQEVKLVGELTAELQAMGFGMSILGKDALSINTLPAIIEESDAQDIVTQIIHGITEDEKDLLKDKQNKMAQWAAKYSAIKTGKKLSENEMEELLAQLFSCKNPTQSAFGKKVLYRLSEADIFSKLT